MDIPKYEQLKQRIRQDIRSGIWRPGEKLPADRILCEQFQVSRITVGNAKRDLLAEGVLENLPGRKGAFIKKDTRGVSSDLIGVAIHDTYDPVVVKMLHGIEEYLRKHEFHPVFSSIYFDNEKAEDFFCALLQRNVAGMIFAGLSGAGHAERNATLLKMLSARQLPHVMIDRVVLARSVNFVAPNHRQAAKELTKRLIAKGHTRILALAGVECDIMNELIHGHRDALEEAGLEQPPELIVNVNTALLQPPFSPAGELAHVRAAMAKARNFTACYAVNVFALRAALQILLSEGTASEKKLDVATYDHNEIQYLQGRVHSVTVARQPSYNIGWEAARILIEQIKNPRQPMVQMNLQSEIFEKDFEQTF